MTTPDGERTGYAHPKCYAAPLADCGGGEMTREHYISKKLLELFGKKFRVTGLAWSDGPRDLTETALRSMILCKRHNTGLSHLDTAIVRLFEAIRAARERRRMTVVLSGDDIERWGFKALFGLLASGSARLENGETLLVQPRLAHLEGLFGFAPIPDGPGFYFYDPRVIDHPEQDAVFTPEMGTAGDPPVDALFGLRSRLIGFTWVTSLVTLDAAGETLIYRPAEIVLNGCVHMTFNWSGLHTPVRLGLNPRKGQGQ